MKQYTSYEDVDAVLEILLNGVKEVLGQQFIGMYLYGSLSSGDFNPTTSDIDFLVITMDLLSEKTIGELESLHQRLWASGRKRTERLEGAYVPQRYIRRHDANNAPCPTINEGKFYLDRLGSDWIIQRHVVREFGVVLEGSDPKNLIDFVSPEDIRCAVLGILHEWWFPMLDDSSWLQKHESNYHGYTVITMCRALHALQHGMIVSKPVAVRWAREKLGAHWHTLIEQAVASQYGQRPEILKETLQFIRLTKEEIEGSDHAQDSH